MASATATPSVTWAQRPKVVFADINVSDVTNPDIKVRFSSNVNVMMLSIDYVGGERLPIF